MSTVSALYSQIGDAINDPDGVEVDTGADSTMLRWINQVVHDAAILTDCLQNSGTVTGDGSAETHDISAYSPTLWRMLSVTDKTKGIVYLPVKRREYQGFRNSIVVNGISDMYVYNVFGQSEATQVYILPIVADITAITLEYSEIPATLLTSDTPPGILGNYDRLIVSGVSAIYYQTNGDFEKYQTAFGEYFDWIKRLAGDVGTNPELLPEMSSLYRFIASQMKELREMR